MNEKVRRVIMSFLGVIITGFAIALLRKSALGADPFSSFIVGLANVFHSAYGTVYPLVMGVFIVIVFFLDKHYLGIATIFNLLIIGPVADEGLKVLDTLYVVDTLYEKSFTFIAAIVVLCFGASLYITADLGVSAYDAIALYMADKKVAQYRYCRIATDAICVFFAFFFKATIGVGTVVSALFMGPLTQFFITYVAEPIRYGKKAKDIKKA